jgi:hypothetical protein
MMNLAAEMASALRLHEEIFRYWKQIKNQGQMRGLRLPGRVDIDPCALRRHLSTISLIDVLSPDPRQDPGAFRQRLAGTELFTAYGVEITGKHMDAIYGPEQASYWGEALSDIVTTGKPNVGLHAMDWSGAKGLYLFWLRLPLASDGEHVDMILGHDVMIGRPDMTRVSGVRAA